MTTGLWSSTAPWKTSSVVPAGSSNAMTSSTRRASASSSDSCLNGTPARVQRGLHPFQRGMVAHLPADGDDLVGLARHDDDAGRPLVHPQVQAVASGPRSLGETQHVESELTPPLDVAGLRP